MFSVNKDTLMININYILFQINLYTFDQFLLILISAVVEIIIYFLIRNCVCTKVCNVTTFELSLCRPEQYGSCVKIMYVGNTGILI